MTTTPSNVGTCNGCSWERMVNKSGYCETCANALVPFTPGPDEYRSAVIYARVMGSNQGTYSARPAEASPFDSAPPARVSRVNGTWRVAECCIDRSLPCAECRVLFVGINPGIQFPSTHTDADWSHAHRMYASYKRRSASAPLVMPKGTW